MLRVQDKFSQLWRSVDDSMFHFIKGFRRDLRLERFIKVVNKSWEANLDVESGVAWTTLLLQSSMLKLLTHLQYRLSVVGNFRLKCFSKKIN